MQAITATSNTNSSSTPAVVDKDALGQQLTTLMTSAAAVSATFVATNKAFYKHLAELYMWWRDANSVHGYLDEQYETVERKFKKVVTHGINFAPLFWLTWGAQLGMNVEKAGRWSRVLNRLHQRYEAEEQYHTDSVVKLAFYIEENGGVDGLVVYGPGGADTDEDDGTGVLANKKDGADQLSEIFRAASSFYGQVSSPTTVDMPNPIPLTADGLGLVLLRKVGSEYHFICSSTDVSCIKPVATQSYLQDFGALSLSIRALIEAISTQCLPSNIHKFYKALTDAAVTSSIKGGKRAVRRLMYVHETGQFLLSPIRAVSGVVTTAKPNMPVLAHASIDTIMPTNILRSLEAKLVAGRNFNMYTASSKDVIPEMSGNSLTASHAMRLKNSFAKSENLSVQFWPYYEGQQKVVPQLITKGLKSGEGEWSATMPSAWFKKLSFEFIAKWLNSHGEHIKRAHQETFKLTFEMDRLGVDFVYIDGAFQSNVTVDFEAVSANGSSIEVFVLTKDFAVAMQSLADLSIASGVGIDVDADGIFMSFATDAADYTVYIPTCNASGKRNTQHFQHYEPLVLALDECDTYNDAEEGELVEELA